MTTIISSTFRQTDEASVLDDEHSVEMILADYERRTESMPGSPSAAGTLRNCLTSTPDMMHLTHRCASSESNTSSHTV